MSPSGSCHGQSGCWFGRSWASLNSMLSEPSKRASVLHKRQVEMVSFTRLWITLGRCSSWARKPAHHSSWSSRSTRSRSCTRERSTIRACPLALLNPRIRQKVASSKLVCAEETEHELEVTLAPPTRNRPKARKSWPSPCTSVDSINGSRLCRCLASSFRLVDCFVANNAKVGDGH